MQNILLSKLIPPNPSMYYLHRKNILKKLSKSANAKLTVIQSGAGYGKTSAITQYLNEQKNPYSWYQVTEEDDDILPFLRHLFFSIQRVCPKFGNSVVIGDSFSKFPNREELNKLSHTFINEFYKIDEECFVVIDDFHLVNHVFQINYILNKIIEHLPSHIHIIIATRIYPNWKCILPLRMNGQLIECNKEDFIFTFEDVQILFEDIFEQSIQHDEINNILTVTEGWPIAISLLAMQSKESPLPLDEITKLSLNDFFAYISQEVFENLEQAQQEALLKYSIFQTFSYELIDSFYGDRLADEINSLMKNHAFIQPLFGCKEFRFHALFKQFLELRLQERTKEHYIHLHKRATTHFIKENNPINAIYHVLKTEDRALIAHTLVQFAPYFLDVGQFDYFFERLRDIPNECRATNYELYFFEGECQRIRAQYEKAKKAYEQCLQLATKEGDQLYRLKAYAGCAHIYLDTIQPALAEKYLSEALKLAESVNIEQSELHLLQRQYAENLVNLGMAKEAQEWVNSKKLPKDILIQGNLDIRILLRQGKLHEARKKIQLREEHAAVKRDVHRDLDVLHALVLSLLGENEKAFLCATTSIKDSKQDYAQFSEAVAYLRKGHALIQLNPSNLEEAIYCYEKTNSLMDEIHVTRAKAESYMGLALVKSRQGLYQEAISYVNLGLYETDRVQDQWVSALLLTAMAIIYIESGKLDEAKEAALKANALYKKSPDHYLDMVTNFWLAFIALEQTEDNQFISAFSKFLELLNKHDYYFFIQKRTLFGPKNVIVLMKMVQEFSIITDQYSGVVEKITQLLTMNKGLPIPKHSFLIQLFGTMKIYRNDKEIHDKEWKREKARELFLYLYIHRHRFVSKEEIMHALWPNSQLDAMNRDFKVVYNACLKVLEPNRVARDESSYIVRKQSMYQLHQMAAFESDVDCFERFATLGMEEQDPQIAQEWLLLAANLYKGNLLEELSSAEWLNRKRDELFHQNILIIERIAQNYIRLENYQCAIEWAEKLVHLDPTWEEGYRLLMLAYYQVNNRPQAVKWYDKCVEVLQEELRIEPMETTNQVYEMIIR